MRLASIPCPARRGTPTPALPARRRGAAARRLRRRRQRRAVERRHRRCAEPRSRPATSRASARSSSTACATTTRPRDVLDDDGNRSSRDALKLGMGVEIHGGGISDDGKGPRADCPRDPPRRRDPRPGLGRSTRRPGPWSCSARRCACSTPPSSTTACVGGFAGIVVGAVLEVHGTLDAATGVSTSRRDSSRPAPTTASESGASCPTSTAPPGPSTSARR